MSKENFENEKGSVNEIKIKEYFKRLKDKYEEDIPWHNGESINDIINRIEKEGWKFVAKVKSADLDSSKFKGKIKIIGLGDEILIFYKKED